MKTTFLPNHKYLNKENIAFIKEGDVIDWYYDTELNGRKHEKVIFKGITKITKSGIYDGSSQLCEAFTMSFIKPECFVSEVADYWVLRPLQNRKCQNHEWFNFVTYCNGWNSLRIKYLNDRNWDEIMIENNLNILSEEEQKNKLILEEVELLKKVSTSIGMVGYKNVFFLHDKSVISKTHSGNNSCIYLTVRGAFANLMMDKPILDTSYHSTYQGLACEINGIQFSTSCRSDYKKEETYLFLTDTISDKIPQINEAKKQACEYKKTSIGMCWVLKEAPKR